ncbi:MAG: hypothetical protein AAF086_08495, partial [Planctomycetota bacterium]
MRDEFSKEFHYKKLRTLKPTKEYLYACNLLNPCSIYILGPEPLWLGKFAHIGWMLLVYSDKPDYRRLRSLNNPIPETFSIGTFFEWFDHTVIYSWGNDSGPASYIPVSRMMLINRVANILGGSHPRNEVTGNRFDSIIRKGDMHAFGGVPAIYWCLIATARDLISEIQYWINNDKQTQ